MKRSELKQRIKEEFTKILKENFELIFIDDSNNEIIYSEPFKSEGEAENFINDQKSYSDNYDEVDYFNPENGKKYPNYKIIPFEQKPKFGKINPPFLGFSDNI